MRRTFIAAALVAAAAAFPTGLRAQDGAVSLPVGTEAPAAEVQDMEGNPLQLLDLVRGKPAVIEFWATWCEQCEALQPHLDQVHERFGDTISMVAVAVGVNQTPRRIQRHLEQHDPGYPYVFDWRGNAARAYEALVTSIVVVLDAEGRVAYTGVGPQQDVMAAVEKVLAATRPPST